MTIGLIEDDKALNFSITLLLKKNGYNVFSFYSAEEVMENIKTNYIDIFIVDLNLPGVNGLTLVNDLKSYFHQSKFFIISADTEINKIENAFALGCEDYIKKPFEIKELLLRVEKSTDKHQFIYDINHEFSYDQSKKILYKQEEEISLTSIESKLLEHLLKNKGIPLSIEYLSGYVWGKEITANTVSSLIRRFHLKIGSKIISNRNGMGYLLEYNI
ncbi:Two-component system response regulator [hydrothermal vent metagenome]|uniref:Two-component system response regulator n=1 Tax=hydrothermal vent metagenome TaxID=652676 RepID=A0A1W1C9U3_9ZZZZ